MKGLLGEEVGEGIAEVLPGDVFAEDGVPELFEEDEADAAVLEFLVAGGEGKGVVDIDTCGEGEGEFQRAQGVEDIAFFGGAEAGVQPREVKGGTQPEADGFAMQEFAIGQGGFDAMADGDVQSPGGFSCQVYKKLFMHIAATMVRIINEKEDLSQYNRFVRDAVIGKLTNPNIITPM